MNWPVSRTDVGIAGLGGLAGLAGSYVAAGPSTSFVGSPIHGVVVAVTPDAVVTFAITVLGEVGSTLSFVAALGIAALVLSLAALAGVRTGRAVDAPLAGGALAAVVAWLVTVLLTGEPLTSLAAGAPPGVVVAAGTGFTASTPARGDRREVLKLAGAVVGFGGVGSFLRYRQSDGDGAGDLAVSPEVRPMLDEAEANSLDVPGIEGVISTIDEFYRVDINAFPPELEAEDWSITVTGDVEEEVSLQYEDITGMAAERRAETLRCVGEPLNGKKMDTAIWTGVSIPELLESVGVDTSGGCCVMLRAADDFYEEFPLAALEDALLAYEMNGQPLPEGHGFPVRAVVPGHWGEISVKWITEIEILDEEQDGYWEERGWHGTGPVETVAKLHAVNHRDDGTVQVGGHAYAGTRGVDRVEVSVDGGDTWADAELSEPPEGVAVWRQWAYEFEPDGTHDVVVRATDGEGTLQPREEADSFPSGPTGWVHKTVQA